MASTSAASGGAPGLSRERVALAAAALVGESGFDQLTLRALARRLGVSAPSLYEHVTSKDDLVDVVVAGILDDAATGWNPPARWDELIRYVGHWWHRLMSEHAAVYTSILRHPMAAPVALDMIERVIEGLSVVGFSSDEAVAAYAQLFGYVVGATALVHTRADVRAARGTTQAEEQRRTERLLEQLDAARYPALVRARTALSQLATEEAFGAGLEALIDGLRDRVGSPPASGAAKRSPGISSLPKGR